MEAQVLFEDLCPQITWRGSSTSVPPYPSCVGGPPCLSGCLARTEQPVCGKVD